LFIITNLINIELHCVVAHIPVKEADNIFVIVFLLFYVVNLLNCDWLVLKCSVVIMSFTVVWFLGILFWISVVFGWISSRWGLVWGFNHLFSGNHYAGMFSFPFQYPVVSDLDYLKLQLWFYFLFFNNHLISPVW
jgi:hypothetical protein